MSNKTYFGNEARAKLKEGIDIVAKSVACTLGANGRNVVFNKFSRVPIVTNDGVSIARHNEPEDLAVLQGANLLKQVAERTNDEAGDGTTTATVLAHAMISAGMDILNTDSKVNPMKLRREMKDAADFVLSEIEKKVIPINTLEELENIATISVESPEIGKTIAKAIKDAGKSGVVYVNDHEDIGVSIEKVEGYQIQQGLISPYLVTNPEKLETVLENPAILLTEMPVHLNDDFLALIGAITQRTKNILIICDEFHPDVLKFAVSNLAKGNFVMSIIKKPMQANYMEDIAALVGGEVMNEQKGKIKYNVNFLGTAEKVIVKQFTTTIIGGGGKDSIILNESGSISRFDSYTKNLQSQLEEATDEPSKVKIQERLAKLTSGVYMLNVGEKTESEAKYLRDKVDDAVNATKAALDEGIVAGGGMTLYNIGKNLLKKKDATDGEKVIATACITPLFQILYNSGIDFSEVEGKFTDDKCGFDAISLEVVPDIIEKGIIDPVKVTKNAFMNAAGFAGLILTTECLISPLPDANKVV